LTISAHDGSKSTLDMDVLKEPITITDSSAQDQQHTGMKPAEPHQRFKDKPYLQCLGTLEDAFPALKSFLEKLANEEEPGRKAVNSHYLEQHRRAPGRCYCLEFKDESNSVIDKGAFESADALREYLQKKPATQSRDEKHRRLFILEDMEPEYVDALGHHLGVDPLVFSEQMNTWNFTDSWSIPHRGLPSMSIPEQSFTLRYYELRTLLEPKSVDVLSLQTSFAVNRRVSVSVNIACNTYTNFVHPLLEVRKVERYRYTFAGQARSKTCFCETMRVILDIAELVVRWNTR
jgi:hypothetical protein